MHFVPIDQIKSEVEVTTTRSSGPGGQHVNKVETKVVLRFNVSESAHLNEYEKQQILKRLGNQLTNDGAIIVAADNHRSQIKNKDLAYSKLEQLLAKAFHIPMVRRATKPNKSAVLKRLKSKKHHSEKKQWRQKDNL